MLSKFKATKIIRLLRICVPMDRAHALLAMSNPFMNDEYGMHWYSKMHLEEDSPSTQETRRQLEEYQRHRRAKGTMDKNLYRLLYSGNRQLNLQEDAEFRSWSQPAFADFVPRAQVLQERQERAQQQEVPPEVQIRRTNGHENLQNLQNDGDSDALGLHLSEADSSTAERSNPQGGILAQ